MTSSSVFEVTDANGVRQFRKNVKSQYEKDAALDHYFYHPNTAPFLAVRFAQRFGISNPSPGYVSRIASAFRSGSYIIRSHQECHQ